MRKVLALTTSPSRNTDEWVIGLCHNNQESSSVIPIQLFCNTYSICPSSLERLQSVTTHYWNVLIHSTQFLETNSTQRWVMTKVLLMASVSNRFREQDFSWVLFQGQTENSVMEMNRKRMAIGQYHNTVEFSNLPGH